MSTLWNQIISAYPPEKRSSDTLWAKIIIRQLSFYVAWLAMKLGLSAFQVSMLSLLMPVIALGFWFTNSPLIAIILLNLWFLLDCVDGNIARARGGTQMGEFVDASSGYVMVGLSYLGLGIYLDLSHAVWMGIVAPGFTIIGALTSILSLLARLYYQKYQNVKNAHEAEISHQIINESSWIKVIDHNVSIGGFFTPSLLLAYFINQLPLLLVLYAAYNSVYFLGSAAILLWRSRNR